MYVYGEDTSVSPPVPGMRAGEEVAFYVDGNLAVASPVLFWQNDFELHQVDLNADTEATPTPTSTTTPTSTPTATSTSTATPTLDPDDPTPTFTPTATPSPGAAPDLIVTDIQARPTAPTVGQPVTITIVVKNQGNVDISTFFYADFYVDHAPTACEGGDGYVRINSLTSGNEVTVTATYAGFTTTGQHSIYAQADSSCQVSEDNETNNAYGPLRLEVQGDSPPTPSAAFDAAPVSGAVPLSVEFDDLSTGQITDWLWDFGDGYTSTLQHPDHVYVVTGTFDVSLYVEGPGGVDMETKAGFISVSELFYVYLPLVIRQ
jgi:PKD repeat protein